MTATPRRLALLFATVVASIASVGRAHAETCAVPAGADAKLADVDAKTRAAFLRDQLESQAHAAGLWQSTWFFARSAILVAEGGLAIVSSDPGDRTDALVTSAFAALPPIGTLLFTLRVSRDGPRFIGLDHLDNDASRCAYVARGEQFLARDAADEDEKRGWIQHALHIAGSTALFLILGLGYEHWRNAILGGLGGVALGELQILSQPTGLVSAWRRYRAGDLGATKASVAISPTFTATSGGIALRVNF